MPSSLLPGLLEVGELVEKTLDDPDGYGVRLPDLLVSGGNRPKPLAEGLPCLIQLLLLVQIHSQGDKKYGFQLVSGKLASERELKQAE